MYNQWCSDRNGVPLLNQTCGLTPAIVQKAYGDRWTTMQNARKTYDPGDRLLNDTSAPLWDEDGSVSRISWSYLCSAGGAGATGALGAADRCGAATATGAARVTLGGAGAVAGTGATAPL